MANTGQGISGSNVGVVTYTNNNIASYAMGTTFADTATRDIFDPTPAGTNGNTAPYIGQYEPEGDGIPAAAVQGRSTSSSRQQLASKAGINGTWTL